MSFIHRKNLRRRFKKAFLIVIALYLLVGIALYFFQASVCFDTEGVGPDMTAFLLRQMVLSFPDRVVVDDPEFYQKRLAFDLHI